MKPFILNYFEIPEGEIGIETALLEYNEELQISVLKGTKTCAFNDLQLATRTMTKAEGEGSDDDDAGGMSFAKFHSGTITYSAVNDETSDSDLDKPKIDNLLGTVTATRMQKELSDSDR